MEIERLGTMPYEQAWDLQRTRVTERVEGRRPDTLLLLEHPSVYTAGRRTLPEERPLDGTPVIDVDRGGKITWHGPGQLVGYPIVALPQPFDVVAHVRTLESLLMKACAELGLDTRRVDGRSGVWTLDGQRKVAAIGVRVTRGVTMHGFALNCDPDLSSFGAIVPCGISDAGVTSLSRELGKTVSVTDALPVVEWCAVNAFEQSDAFGKVAAAQTSTLSGAAW
jgi:lipoyl(octanoyl) transferase